MCLINADFFPNHHVSCCEINSAPQNHKELGSCDDSSQRSLYATHESKHAINKETLSSYEEILYQLVPV